MLVRSVEWASQGRLVRLGLAVAAGSMRFDSIDAVKCFVGDDYEVAHVPPRAREVRGSEATHVRMARLLLNDPTVKEFRTAR